MNIKSIGCLIFFSIVFLFSCDPKKDPIECLPDSINELNGIIYNGFITLCNAQGPANIVFEPAICSLQVNTDSLIFSVFSTNPNFYYYYSDTLAYDCEVYEGTARVFNLYDISGNSDMGVISETQNDIHLVIIDDQCPNSSFFEVN